MREKWVMRNERPIVRKDGTKVAHVSWWYGPKHGWGRIFGPLGYSVEKFETRKAAETAWRSEFGRLRSWTRAQRLSEAEAEQEKKREKR